MENNQNNNEKQGKGKHYLIVVDMQKDFIDGSLGTEEAQSIVEKVKEKILSYPKDRVYATLDTHGEDYLSTQEGKMLPVPHCIKGTEGWGLHPMLKDLILPDHFFEKGSFGSLQLAESMRTLFTKQVIEEATMAKNTGNIKDTVEIRGDAEIGAYPDFTIELVGLCTDICVVSNALLLKAFLPEIPISVDSSCCAGVTKEKHLAALETLRSCQVEVL
ncbi:MAG: cysteine hydrolase [Oribacterium parvum]|uniref:nicotinamidase n=1 Tax=Oribacterium parvum TaxID=1501329 RepID=A0A930GYH7_9FIRM|nr:cysteine hydrolase [Oribacterium parvum]